MKEIEITSNYTIHHTDNYKWSTCNDSFITIAFRWLVNERYHELDVESFFYPNWCGCENCEDLAGVPASMFWVAFEAVEQ